MTEKKLCRICRGTGEYFDRNNITTRCSSCKGTGWLIIKPKEFVCDKCNKDVGTDGEQVCDTCEYFGCEECLDKHKCE